MSDNIQPYYEDGQVTLYNNDMKDVVNMLDDKSVDLILTDPPYGINYVSNHRKEKLKDIENDDVLYMDIDLFWDKIRDTGSLWSFYSHKVELNDNKSNNEYTDCSYEILLSAINDIKRELNSGNPSKTNIKIYVDTALDLVNENIKMEKSNKPHLTRIKNRIIWVKNNWTAGDLEGDYGNQYECIAFMPKDKFKLRGHRYSNVWKFDRVPPSNHPTEKPVALLSRIIESCTDVGGLVFDPFGGSGATLFACKRLNRKCVIAEIDEEHCQNIVNDNRLKQMGLGI